MKVLKKDNKLYKFITNSDSPSKPTLKPFSESSFNDIKQVLDAYYNDIISLDEIKLVWDVKDTLNIDLSVMEAIGVGESHRAQTVQLQILDFEHDDLVTPINGKTKALLSLDLKNCLRDAKVTDTDGKSNTEHGYINSSDTNFGSWETCARRTWCNNVFYNSLPDDFKSLVKQVKKLTSAGNRSTSIITTNDYCFLLSEIEIYGSYVNSISGEGSQYELYKTTANRYKLPKYNSSYVSNRWWGRSPYASASSGFCFVHYNGNATWSSANFAVGIAPALCL